MRRARIAGAAFDAHLLAGYNTPVKFAGGFNPMDNI
jgi:hypothetical protein